MRTVLGILVLIAGVVFPLAMVGWLAFRMGKKPALPANAVGLVLAFNGLLPLGLVLFGLGLMSPAFWSVGWVRVAATAASAAAVVVLSAFILSMRKRSTIDGR